MGGYHLIETGTSLPEADRPPERLGFLDFLRELAGEDAAVPKFWRVTVSGLEEVLFGAGDDADALAWEIHRRLRDAAPELERKLADVYVEFRGRLQRGDDLWSEYRGTRLPIGHIFGSPPPQTRPDGRRTFFANFNLTHGG